jgi:hypothetical protein
MIGVSSFVIDNAVPFELTEPNEICCINYCEFSFCQGNKSYGTIFGLNNGGPVDNSFGLKISAGPVGTFYKIEHPFCSSIVCADKDFFGICYADKVNTGFTVFYAQVPSIFDLRF